MAGPEYEEWCYDLAVEKLEGISAMLLYAKGHPKPGIWSGKHWETAKGSRMKWPIAFMYVKKLDVKVARPAHMKGDLINVSMFPLSDYDEKKETE